MAGPALRHLQPSCPELRPSEALISPGLDLLLAAGGHVARVALVPRLWARKFACRKSVA